MLRILLISYDCCMTTYPFLSYNIHKMYQNSAECIFITETQPKATCIFHVPERKKKQKTCNVMYTTFSLLKPMALPGYMLKYLFKGVPYTGSGGLKHDVNATLVVGRRLCYY